MEQKRKTSGRQKIKIEKIEKQNKLQVTFSKRRTGLFNKASELSILCGVDIAILIQSPAGRFHAYGSSPVDSIVNRYRYGRLDGDSVDPVYVSAVHAGVHRYSEIKMKLEAEERTAKAFSSEGAKGWWCDSPIENMTGNELEEFLAALEAMRDRVINRADEMAGANAALEQSSLMPNASVGGFGGLQFPL